MNVSDRIAVIYDGTIVDTVIPAETTEQEFGLLMAGQSKEEIIIVEDEVVLKEGDDLDVE